MAPPPPRGSLLHYVRPGARIGVAEWVPIMLCAFALHFLSSDAIASGFWTHNALRQLAFFSVAVFAPAAVTQQLSYVDVGWPLGLCLVAANAYTFVRPAAPAEEGEPESGSEGE